MYSVVADVLVSSRRQATDSHHDSTVALYRLTRIILRTPLLITAINSFLPWANGGTISDNFMYNFVNEN